MNEILIPHNKPTLGKEEISAIEEVMKNGWIAEGKKVEEFEEEFCKYIGVPPFHAVALSNGTSALYLALKVLGVKIGDEVIAPTYVCSAVLNAIYMVGAKPILTDVEKRDFNISYQDIIGKISNKTKSIIVSHTFGVPADITLIRKFGIPIIEDCAVALGSKIGNQHVGVFGNIAIFSFYASKVITTGYGGMLVSKNYEFVEKARDYREFDCRKKYKPRFNFQMSDLQAAIGKVQLKKLPLFLEKRKKIANEYYKILPKNKVWPPYDIENKEPNFYRFLIRSNKPRIIKDSLEKEGIKTIIPIETYELLHRYLNENPAHFPVSENISKTTLSLPIYPSLNSSNITRIKFILKENFLKNND